MAINFPDSPANNALFSSGGKTWEYDGTAWIIKAATTSIATESITYDKLAADAVTTVKIADGAITAAKIADGTVVAAEIASSAITTAKINDAAVTTAKINDAAVTTAKILDSNVTTAKINDAAVTTAKVNDAAVTTAKINDAAVTQAKLGTTLSAVTVTTAANRDTAVASPFTGQLVFLTDTKKIQVWDGTAWLNITLAPPETPTSLSATALSTTSVSIAFTAGGANGSPITNYKYALSTNGGSTYGSFIALSPEDITTPITISGLTAATAYYIKLKAVNDMGDSVASSAVSISTLSTPEAPTSLSAGSITNNSVAISFTAGAQGGSAISNYQYALSTDSGSTYGSFTALSPADATTPITISGLTAGTAYYIKLKAVNTDGAGTASSAVSFTTLNPSPTVDYLVIAGAGSGGVERYYSGTGGGGGAGGFRSTVTATGGGGTLETALAVTLSTNYTVTVGAGGAGGLVAGVGNDGSNSVFSTITSIGGGGGGGGFGTPDINGRAGGSGGGRASDVAGTPGAGTANQGFSGGVANTQIGGGGGGGAGAVGGTGSSGTGGVGGVGVATAISGSSVFRGGGGGGDGNPTGGLGGNGGGGKGGDTSVGTSGTANTGGGGGGSQNYSSVGAGGSGIVILRYSDVYDNITTIGAGLTYTLANTGGYKIYSFTAGTGSITI